jgi:tetratricopeptide (TPR) repeat protein
LEAYRLREDLQASQSESRSATARCNESEDDGWVMKRATLYNLRCVFRVRNFEKQMTITQAMEMASRHHAPGQWQVAERLYKQILSVDPALADAQMNLGIALASQSRVDEAIAAFETALVLRPDSADEWFNLGNALFQSQQTSRAVEAFSKALSLRHDFPQAWNNLSLAQEVNGNLSRAIEASQTAIKLRPTYGDAYANLGRMLRTNGELPAAVDACRRAIELKGDVPAIHFSLATALLLAGDFENGLREFEWRRVDPSLQLRRPSSLPSWDGSLLAGRRIALYAEQGLGDAIQFIRYLPFVACQSGRIVLHCHAELVKLLEQFPQVEKIVPFGTTGLEADVCCPLESLPFLARTTESTIPAFRLPWQSQACQSEFWHERLKSIPERFKIGIVWAGSNIHLEDCRRSITLSQLGPLMQLPDIAWISLQKQSTSPLQSAGGLHDWTADLRDFSDTAALISRLDLVISVDTAVAHLAGALGKPVWMLLAFVPDWRWMLHRTDSPWYPTMRLFRQTEPGNWHTPIAEMASALRRFTAGT